MIAAVLFIIDERPRALAMTLAIGALTRESAMFLIPLAYAIWAERLIDVDALRRVAIVSAPAIAIYLALRLAIPTVGREQVAGYGGSLLGGRFDVLHDGLDQIATELRRMFTVYGPLWFIAPFALRNMRLAQRGLVLVALCVVSMTFALDWGRIILLAAPIFYAAGAFVLRDKRQLSIATLAAFAVLIVALRRLHAAQRRADGHHRDRPAALPRSLTRSPQRPLPIPRPAGRLGRGRGVDPLRPRPPPRCRARSSASCPTGRSSRPPSTWAASSRYAVLGRGQHPDRRRLAHDRAGARRPGLHGARRLRRGGRATSDRRAPVVLGAPGMGRAQPRGAELAAARPAPSTPPSSPR